MTASLPAEVQQVFDRFITTEFTTSTRAGGRSAGRSRPTTEPGDPCIDVTTALGYPEEGARRARRTRRSRCCSRTPPAAGWSAAPQVLVQGIADVDDRDLEANRERYTRESAEKLPGSKELLPPKPLQRAVQLLLHPPLRPRAAGARLRLAGRRRHARAASSSTRTWRRSARATTRSRRRRPPAPQGGPPVWDERMDELGAQLPGGGAVARRARRLPVQRARADLGRPGGAARPDRRRRARRAGAAAGSPASPPTTTRPTSSGSGTSRCAATSWRRTAAGRSCRTG